MPVGRCRSAGQRHPVTPIDDADVVWCPADLDAPIIRRGDGTGIAVFGDTCRRCLLRERCTTAAGRRTIAVGRHEARMQQAKADQATPEWQAAYRATRPEVEGKIGHLTRRAWGGRKARTRGVDWVVTDFVTAPLRSTSPASPHSASATT